MERGLPVLLGASAASASSGVLTEELRVLPAAEALLLLASIYAALKICLAHRTRWVLTFVMCHCHMSFFATSANSSTQSDLNHFFNHWNDTLIFRLWLIWKPLAGKFLTTRLLPSKKACISPW